jgi:hypothetical protein
MGKMKAIKIAIEEMYPEMAQELEKEFNLYLRGKIKREDISPELEEVLDSV